MAFLRFDVRRDVLDIALSIFGERPDMDLGPSSAGPNVVRVGDMLPEPVVAYLKQSTRARAAFRRVVRNAGKRAINRIRKAVRRLDLISPQGTPTRGLFLSSWRAEMRDVTGIGFKLDLIIVNAAPYTLYVHPKGTSKRRTFVNTDLPKLMGKIAAEIGEDLKGMVAALFGGR